MDSPPKENCKYGAECYQKNEHHRQKYNHPEIKENDSPAQSTENVEEKDGSKKRKTSEESDESPTHAKKNNPQRQLPWQSPDQDYTELLKSNRFIYAKFLVKMPKDFYQFWNFAKEINTEKNGHIFDNFNFKLVGPYDFMAGRFANMEQKSPAEYLRHWRFYYDPPEFQTVIVKKGTGVHYGYWRDDTKNRDKLIIARNDAAKGCHFEIVATNMFDALAYFLEKDFHGNPFTQTEIIKVRKGLNEYVTKNNIDRSPVIVAKANRIKSCATKTFHGVGIMVPVNKKSTIGYRPLIESDVNIKKILKIFDEAEDPDSVRDTVMDKLQPIITAAIIALDECDFGTNFELGIDLFCSGHEQLHATVLSLLVSAYTLLERKPLLTILKAHLENRRKSFELSMIH